MSQTLKTIWLKGQFIPRKGQAIIMPQSQVLSVLSANLLRVVIAWRGDVVWALWVLPSGEGLGKCVGCPELSLDHILDAGEDQAQQEGCPGTLVSPSMSCTGPVLVKG